MTRGDHKGAFTYDYKGAMEAELQQMEAEGLWTQVDVIETDKYMKDPSTMMDEQYMSGSVYLYKKSIK